MSARTLVVVSDRVGGQGNAAPAPRRDYAELSARLGAAVIDASVLNRDRGRGVGGLLLAKYVADGAERYDNVFCDSEHVGLPLAFMIRNKERRPRLTMIAHYLSPMKKRALIRILHLHRTIDALVLHSPAQKVRGRALGFRDEQLVDVPYQVDTSFWHPLERTPAHIASAGQEFRDYLTLMRAVEGLDVEVKIAAGSHWSSRRPTFTDRDVPSNVTLDRLPYTELREQYAASHFVVVPLLDVDFQAGIITILEAMAMGKAVIVSRTAGQLGVVSGPQMERGTLHDIGEGAWPDDTGIYVRPGDVTGLRDAIIYLRERPDVARRMGRAARHHVEAAFSLERFVERMAAVIAPERQTAPRALNRAT